MEKIENRKNRIRKKQKEDKLKKGIKLDYKFGTKEGHEACKRIKTKIDLVIKRFFMVSAQKLFKHPFLQLVSFFVLQILASPFSSDTGIKANFV